MFCYCIFLFRLKNIVKDYWDIQTAKDRDHIHELGKHNKQQQQRHQQHQRCDVLCCLFVVLS